MNEIKNLKFGIVLLLSLAMGSTLPAESHKKAKQPHTAPDVSTKLHCVTIDIERNKPISITAAKKGTSTEGQEKREPYKVLMTVKGQPNWEVFEDYGAAKDFAAYLKKNGAYKLCTFTPPSGPSWTEIMIGEESGENN